MLAPSGDPGAGIGFRAMDQRVYPILKIAGPLSIGIASGVLLGRNEQRIKYAGVLRTLPVRQPLCGALSCGQADRGQP